MDKKEAKETTKPAQQVKTPSGKATKTAKTGFKLSPKILVPVAIAVAAIATFAVVPMSFPEGINLGSGLPGAPGGAGSRCDLSSISAGLQPYPDSVTITEGVAAGSPYVTCSNLGASTKEVNDYFVNQLQSNGWSVSSDSFELGGLGTTYEISATKGSEEVSIDITSGGHTVSKKGATQGSGAPSSSQPAGSTTGSLSAPFACKDLLPNSEFERIVGQSVSDFSLKEGMREGGADSIFECGYLSNGGKNITLEIAWQGPYGLDAEGQYRIDKRFSERIANGSFVYIYRDVTGVGSEAFYGGTSGSSVWAATHVLTNTKKYYIIADFSFTDVKTPDDLAIETELAKVVNANLNNY